MATSRHDETFPTLKTLYAFAEWLIVEAKIPKSAPNYVSYIYNHSIKEAGDAGAPVIDASAYFLLRRRILKVLAKNKIESSKATPFLASDLETVRNVSEDLVCTAKLLSAIGCRLGNCPSDFVFDGTSKTLTLKYQSGPEKTGAHRDTTLLNVDRALVEGMVRACQLYGGLQGAGRAIASLCKLGDHCFRRSAAVFIARSQKKPKKGDCICTDKCSAHFGWSGFSSFARYSADFKKFATSPFAQETAWMEHLFRS